MNHHFIIFGFALACFAGMSMNCVAAENTDTTGAANTGADAPIERIPSNAYENRPAVGVPVSSIFRNSNAPYYNTMRDLKLTPTFQAGESVNGRANIDLPDFRGRFPLLQRGFAPEDADLKAGPIYFKLRHISAAALYSDNIYHSDARKEDDVIGIMSIGGQILAQLTEGFQIAASGSFVYLPFEGESGFSNFALRAPYAFGLAASPISNAQIAWEPVLFGLPFVIANEFRVGIARYSNTAHDGFELFEGFEFDEVDRAGIYRFTGPTFRPNDNFAVTEEQSEFETLYYSNEASISTSGRFPFQSVFYLRGSHENIWYEEDRFGLPSERQMVQFHVESVRESLRFKPYFDYTMLRRDNPDRLDHTLMAGIKGPISELLQFRAQAGVLLQTEPTERQDFLWRVGLYHRPSPFTRQSLEYFRETSDFNDELSQGARYFITKTLGPDINGTGYFGYFNVEDLNGRLLDRDEWRTGLALTYYYSPRTTYRVSGQFARIDYSEGGGSSDTWRGRFECSHRFLERLYGRFIYQYEHRDHDRDDLDYGENLLYLSLSLLFD